MIRVLFICFLILPAALSAYQRSDKEIKKKQKELEKLRSDIQTDERRLQRSEAREKSTLEVLDDLEHQSGLIRKLITSLKEEEKGITAEIKETQNSVSALESQLQQVRAHYAGYVRSVYKHARVYDIELLFSSSSINQLFIRIEYLKKFSQQRVKDLAEIRQKKTALEGENAQLQKSLSAERELLSEKTREERNLKEKFAHRKTVLRRIRKDKKNYKLALERKNAAAGKLAQLIADDIEKEREAAEARKRALAASLEREKAARKATSSRNAEEGTPSSTFELRKGKLLWPVAHGLIPPEGKFGRHTHPDLKTVTQNTGVDIKTSDPPGSDVLAVADGEVATISFIPGFGNVLILNHYSGYRTVYAHLSEISVSESERVKEGNVIGRSGESVDGSQLHFEIWKEKDKLNPENWLAKRK